MANSNEPDRALDDPQLWTRHIADSLQLFAGARRRRSGSISAPAAAFPGLVIACALADRPAGRAVHLVESNAKKAAFLREAACASPGMPATVHAVRIEDFVEILSGPVDVVTARALAPLSRF